MRSSLLPLFAAGLHLVSALPAPAPQAPPADHTTVPELTINPDPVLASHSALLAALPPLISSSSNTNETFTNIGSFETRVASDPPRTALGDYENGLYTGKCAPVTVIYARGTAESGNVGYLAGPPFFDALRALVGAANVNVQGVDYAADTLGFFEGGDMSGSTLMATYIQATLTACPYTKLCISGYSQGGQVVHKAAALLPATTMALVDSVVIFGDPFAGYAVQGVPASRTLVLCHTGDDICAHGDLVLYPHMTYAADALTAAQFVAYQLYVKK